MDKIVADWIAEAEVRPAVPYATAAAYDNFIAAFLALNDTQAELEHRGINEKMY